MVMLSFCPTSEESARAPGLRVVDCKPIKKVGLRFIYGVHLSPLSVLKDLCAMICDLLSLNVHQKLA